MTTEEYDYLIVNDITYLDGIREARNKSCPMPSRDKLLEADKKLKEAVERGYAKFLEISGEVIKLNPKFWEMAINLRPEIPENSPDIYYILLSDSEAKIRVSTAMTSYERGLHQTPNIGRDNALVELKISPLDYVWIPGWEIEIITKMEW